MDLTTPVSTAFGEVPLADVLKAFEKAKQYAAAKAEWYKTDEGRAYNRLKAKEYYERNKQFVLDKRAKRYETDRETLLNRAKEYYSAHTEEVKEKNRKRKQTKKETPTEA